MSRFTNDLRIKADAHGEVAKAMAALRLAYIKCGDATMGDYCEAQIKHHERCAFNSEAQANENEWKTNRTLYLVRFREGYNTVLATSQTDAEKQAKVQFTKYGIVSVALPKPGEIDALDAEWSSRLR